MLRLLLALALTTSALAKDCIPFDQAPDHIGKTVCVTGKVLKVGQSQSGSMFLDFCDDYRQCPFVVFVYRSSLKNIGDVRVLEGQTIEITGKVKEWNDRAEIILKNRLQLEGMAEKLPQVPSTLRSLVLKATHPAPSRRTADVPAVLLQLATAERVRAL